MEIFRNLENTVGEEYVGDVNSLQECIELVQAECEWANIANVDDDVLHGAYGDCWCQKGNDKTSDETSEYINCWLGPTDLSGAFPSESFTLTLSSVSWDLIYILEHITDKCFAMSLITYFEALSHAPCPLL